MRRYSPRMRCRSANTTEPLQRAVTHDWYSGSRGRSHHRGPRKTASASTSDDDGPLITRWWWPRPLRHHRQQQHATEHQVSSKPVAGPEGNCVSLTCNLYLYIYVWHKKGALWRAFPLKDFVDSRTAIYD